MDIVLDCLGITLTTASGESGSAFFGFSEFIGAFALLVVVFMIADVQYRFRISVSPLPLTQITFWAIGVIGFGTLLTNIWVSQGWVVVYVPYVSYAVIQGMFAAAFLTTAMAWLYFAFVKPPVFSKWNAKKYGDVLFNYILRGSESELPIIVKEVGRSADKLIEVFASHRTKLQEQKQKRRRGEKTHPNPGNYASDIMWMIGNRKFCRHVIASSPSTAILLFQATTNNNVYDAPIGLFAKNVSTESIMNPDSNLYHEDSSYESGLFGDLKPFTQAIYGTYRLVEDLKPSPLDVDFKLTRDWTGDRLEAYARAVLTAYEDMLSNGDWHRHSYSLTRAFGRFKDACWDVYTLDGVENGDPDVYKKLSVCVNFIMDVIGLLEKHEENIKIDYLKPHKDFRQHDIYDPVAKLMSEIIYNASTVTKPWWPCWNIQHNTVWSRFFDNYGGQSKARKVIAFKLRRLIYDEITDFDKYTDSKSFKAARYLGISINCLGFRLSKESDSRPATSALQKVVLSWLKKNYLPLYKSHPTVAKACLMGNVTFDEKNKQLAITYQSHPDRDAPRDLFLLAE